MRFQLGSDRRLFDYSLGPADTEPTASVSVFQLLSPLSRGDLLAEGLKQRPCNLRNTAQSDEQGPSCNGRLPLEVNKSLDMVALTGA